jgi:hypothetical protein
MKKTLNQDDALRALMTIGLLIVMIPLGLMIANTMLSAMTPTNATANNTTDNGAGTYTTTMTATNTNDSAGAQKTIDPANLSQVAAALGVDLSAMQATTQTATPAVTAAPFTALAQSTGTGTAFTEVNNGSLTQQLMEPFSGMLGTMMLIALLMPVMMIVWYVFRMIIDSGSSSSGPSSSSSSPSPRSPSSSSSSSRKGYGSSSRGVATSPYYKQAPQPKTYVQGAAGSNVAAPASGAQPTMSYQDYMQLYMKDQEAKMQAWQAAQAQSQAVGPSSFPGSPGWPYGYGSSPHVPVDDEDASYEEGAYHGYSTTRSSSSMTLYVNGAGHALSGRIDALPGLKPMYGGGVAEVSRNGGSTVLKNLSDKPWTVFRKARCKCGKESYGDTCECGQHLNNDPETVATGTTIEVKPGTRIKFGIYTGEVRT